MYIGNIFLILTCSALTQGFDFKVKYCRFRCSNPCDIPEDKSNPLGSADPPGAYYWRDFHGVIPTDAYQLGPSTQFPQTYIGHVFDPSKNGTFTTTIFDGIEYVYAVLDNETTKIDKNIQILCTKSPGKLSWIEITTDNVEEITSTYKIVLGGSHVGMVNRTRKAFYHYVVKTNKCHMTYAGFVSALNVDLEYALIDGSSDTSKEYLWLVYKEDESANNPETSGPSTSKGFLNHHYDYRIRPNSIIPKFYEQVTIGSCSVTCTNEENGKIKKAKNDEQLSSSMAYFWQPNPVIDTKEAFEAGRDIWNKTLYVGQAYSLIDNIWDVGYSSGGLESVFVAVPGGGYVEGSYYHILSTNFPEKLKWVNTTTHDFPSLDRKRMIAGSIWANGTVSYVCRQSDGGYVGSARIWPIGTYCYVIWGASSNYQVLMYDPE